MTVRIGDENIIPSKSVRNLGAILDYNMTMEKHIISSVCKSGYGQLRQIGHIRKYLNVTIVIKVSPQNQIFNCTLIKNMQTLLMIVIFVKNLTLNSNIL